MRHHLDLQLMPRDSSANSFSRFRPGCHPEVLKAAYSRMTLLEAISSRISRERLDPAAPRSATWSGAEDARPERRGQLDTRILDDRDHGRDAGISAIQPGRVGGDFL